MNVILLAYTNWGVKPLQAIANSKHRILHVYTHPPDMDKNEKIWFDSVKKNCDDLDIPVEEKTTLTESDAQFIKNLSPDVILSLNWRRLIPRSIFTIPKYGTINAHVGFLPRYRGFAPINWAIINGETETAITLHYVDDSADTGDILLQKTISIGSEETAFDVYSKALTLIPNLILETLSLLESGKIKPISQKNMKGFFCSRRFPEDGKINWLENRVKIHDLIRALSDPFPNAFFFYEGKKIFIKKAKLENEDFRGPPGRICAIKQDGIVVTCGNDNTNNQSLLIEQIGVDDKLWNPKDYFTNLWISLQ